MNDDYTIFEYTDRLILMLYLYNHYLKQQDCIWVGVSDVVS